jgi:hypothetical protein
VRNIRLFGKLLLCAVLAVPFLVPAEPGVVTTPFPSTWELQVGEAISVDQVLQMPTLRLVEYRRLDPRDRSVVLNALTPENRSALWREHFEAFLDPSAGLTPAQASVVRRMWEESTPANHRRADAVRAEFASGGAPNQLPSVQVCQSALTLFSRDEHTQVFSMVGTLPGDFPNGLPTPIVTQSSPSLLSRIAGIFRPIALQARDCDQTCIQGICEGFCDYLNELCECSEYECNESYCGGQSAVCTEYCGGLGGCDGNCTPGLWIE